MKKMRKIERQMETKEALELLNKGEYGVLSTTDSTNQPYGVPLSYAYCSNIIYFHCAPEGSKLENIVENNKVCFTVVGRTNILPEKFSTEYESVICFGIASQVNGDEKVVALREIIKKYSPEFVDQGEEYINRAVDKTAVVRIDIQGFTGKHRI